MSSSNRKKHEDRSPVQGFLVGRFQRRLLALLAEEPPQELLEAGAGEGFLLAKITQRFSGLRVRGFDVDETILADGRKLFPTLDLRQGDIFHIQEPDKSWDCVLASEVLEHLDHPELALAELGRVAKRFVYLSVPQEPWFRLGNLGRGRHLRRLGNHPEHINLWTRASFVRFVNSRLTVDKVVPSFPWTIIRARVR